MDLVSGSFKGAFLAMGGLLLTAGSALAASGPPGASAATASPAAPAGPVSIADLLSPATLSMASLSPSGRSIIAVRRAGDLDQVIRVDLPDFIVTAVFQTRALTKKLSDAGFRQSVSYLAWKSDNALVLSVNSPVNFVAYGQAIPIEEPIHLILAADGKSPPLYLNEVDRGGAARVDLSWIQSILKDDPGHVIIGVRKSVFEVKLFRVDVSNGSRVLLETGGENVVGYGADRRGNIVTRELENSDGSLTLQSRGAGQTAWVKMFDFRKREERELERYGLLGLGEPGVLYVSVKPETPADGDTETVHTYDLRTHQLGPVVWSNPTFDVDSIVQFEETGELLGGCYWVDTLQCDFKDARLTSNFKALNKFFEGKRSIEIVSQARDNSQWLLLVSGPEEPGTYFVYDVTAHRLTPLSGVWSKLPSEKLGKMRRFEFTARDGRNLFGYVTEPPDGATSAAPLVVMPHGGPEARDYYAFDLWSQFLATRGYVVLQPIFRGSGGFGRKFAEMGYGQWGGVMHDDVMDATRALVAEGHVDRGRVAIVGGSYGGYEALYSAAREPETFRCAVSIDGLSDLESDVKWERSFGKESTRYTYWLKSLGDPVVDRDRLNARSPILMASDWKTPTLLIHGDEDGIVQVEQSRRMQRALQEAGKSVKYIEIKGMGHGPSTDEENTKVLGEIESFLASCMGTGSTTAQVMPGPSKPGH